jgi:hypothetical protein
MPSTPSLDPYWQGSRHIPASAIAVVAVTLLMIAIGAIWPAHPDPGAVVPEQHSSLVFPYQGREWVAAPLARTVTVPDEAMAPVAMRNRVALYTPVGGGGGLYMPESRTFYVRLDDGMYVPLIPKGTREPRP